MYIIYKLCIYNQKLWRIKYIKFDEKVLEINCFQATFVLVESLREF